MGSHPLVIFKPSNTILTSLRLFLLIFYLTFASLKLCQYVMHKKKGYTHFWIICGVLYDFNLFSMALWLWHIWWIQHLVDAVTPKEFWQNKHRFGRFMHDFGAHFVTKGHKNPRWQNFIINICIFFTIFHLEWTSMMKWAFGRPLHNLWHWPYMGFSKVCDTWLLNRLKSYSIPGP